MQVFHTRVPGYLLYASEILRIETSHADLDFSEYSSIIGTIKLKLAPMI